jgi:hypothetical protein
MRRSVVKYMYELVVTQSRKALPGVSQSLSGYALETEHLQVIVRSCSSAEDPFKAPPTKSSSSHEPNEALPSVGDGELVLEEPFVRDCTEMDGVFFSKIFQRGLHVCSMKRLEFLQALIRSSGCVFNTAINMVCSFRVIELQVSRMHRDWTCIFATRGRGSS